MRRICIAFHRLRPIQYLAYHATSVNEAGGILDAYTKNTHSHWVYDAPCDGSPYLSVHPSSEEYMLIVAVDIISISVLLIRRVCNLRSACRLLCSQDAGAAWPCVCCR